MRNQIVILAAGKGTRMGQSDLPKVLVMLKNKPIILYLLGEIQKINQLVKPVIVVGYKHSQVRDVLGEDYLYAFQKQQLGTGHAVMCAEPKITAENILVLYGDMPFIKAESLKKLMRLHQETKAKISMFTCLAPSFQDKYENLNQYGRIIRDEYDKIVKITEFKDANLEEREKKEVNPGIYMFNTKWLSNNIGKIKNQNSQNEYYLTDIVEVAIEKGEIIQSLVINPIEVLGINTALQLALAEKIA